MNAILYLFGSGLALFLGVALVLVAVASFHLGAFGWRASLVSIVALAGLAIIALSAAPLSYWVCGVAGVVSLGWIIAERWERPWLVQRRAALRLAVVVVWLGAAVLELPYQFLPRISPAAGASVYVIGDSLSAGAGAGEAYVWPDRLPENVTVHNLARAGATVRTAQQQADQLPAGATLVVLEISGNDLLSGTTSADFERNLNDLLQQVSARDRQMVMFELPLPPTYNEFGRVQRRLAQQHGVRLVPKRVLMRVLAGDGATLDSIHLSPSGHERLAAAVWQLLEPAYAASHVQR